MRAMSVFLAGRRSGAAIGQRLASSGRVAGGPDAGVVAGGYDVAMDSGRARAYQARPGRRAVVAADLADLRGPASGLVELPLRLFWSLPGHRFDLGDKDMRLWLYQTVLREAIRPADLSGYLDRDLLIELWPDLYLPRGVRLAWEDRHPVLRAAAAA
jgi:hypothetical protein